MVRLEVSLPKVNVCFAILRPNLEDNRISFYVQVRVKPVSDVLVGITLEFIYGSHKANKPDVLYSKVMFCWNSTLN